MSPSWATQGSVRRKTRFLFVSYRTVNRLLCANIANNSEIIHLSATFFLISSDNNQYLWKRTRRTNKLLTTAAIIFIISAFATGYFSTFGLFLAAEAALLPEEIKTIEQLFLTGLHIDQYRHATNNPGDYYEEAFHRPTMDVRCKNSLVL
ncbi:MAG: hypothetical protein MSA30_10410 [Prevotella sp.]|nr:hypothetical protein [Prevotella sp.]